MGERHDQHARDCEGGQKGLPLPRARVEHPVPDVLRGGTPQLVLFEGGPVGEGEAE